VRGISDVQRREIFGLIEADGAGKTTVSVLAGVDLTGTAEIFAGRRDAFTDRLSDAVLQPLPRRRFHENIRYTANRHVPAEIEAWGTLPENVRYGPFLVAWPRN
jgi:ABC-type branched-subunit amino acid transport system ATPase component